jgi:hypothetical protein
MWEQPHSTIDNGRTNVIDKYHRPKSKRRRRRAVSLFVGFADDDPKFVVVSGIS